tara:strand:- start:50 stop:661 length:612 start_codon:yes stop_codon:yes gene_type:complete
MKSRKVKKSLLFSILTVGILRLLFIIMPIYISEKTVVVRSVLKHVNIGEFNHINKCSRIKVKFDKLNNQSIFYLNSRSLNKQKSIKCINEGENYIENLVNENNDYYDTLLFEYEKLNNKIDDLINDLNSNKSLNKEKLILINDYFNLLYKLGDNEKIPLPISNEIETIPINNEKLFRVLLAGFILSFWLTYVLLEEVKKPNYD